MGQSYPIHACTCQSRHVISAFDCVHVHNVGDLPQARLDSEINARFLLSGHGELYFYNIVIVYKLILVIGSCNRTEVQFGL